LQCLHICKSIISKKIDLDQETSFYYTFTFVIMFTTLAHGEYIYLLFLVSYTILELWKYIVGNNEMVYLTKIPSKFTQKSFMRSTRGVNLQIFTPANCENLAVRLK
jgi:hypothetical protein